MGKARGKPSEGGPQLAWRKMGREKKQQQTTFRCSLKLGLCGMEEAPLQPLPVFSLSVDHSFNQLFSSILTTPPFCLIFLLTTSPSTTCSFSGPLPSLLHVKVRINPRPSPLPASKTDSNRQFVFFTCLLLSFRPFFYHLKISKWNNSVNKSDLMYQQSGKLTPLKRNKGLVSCSQMWGGQNRGEEAGGNLVVMKWKWHTYNLLSF